MPVRDDIRSLWESWRFRVAGRIIIGASRTSWPGWLSTQRVFFDVTDRECFARCWRPGTRRAFLAEHVFEHLGAEEAEAGARNCFEFLRRGGWLRIAVPDGFHPDPSYVDAVRPGGSGPGADGHKVLYDHRTLQELLERCGYVVRLLEYWDGNGRFHFADWSSRDGHVRRSSRYDPRNAGGRLVYTSLIADGLKP